MRIKSGYISGFGKLNNYPLVFENDLFSLCEENGFGKTTICEFIGAMFYGLPELKSSSKSDNLRGKYAPLGGSLFGGSLTVCDDFGKEYRIEREFSKTGSKDSLKMFDEMGNALEIYKSPGEMLLGLDKDAYERTLSMHFTLDESFDNPTISAKLNNLFINSSEDVSVDEALNEIKKELKEYEGKHGLITLNDAEIKKVLKQLDEIEALDKLYRKDYHLYGDLKMELAELKRKSEKALLEKEMKRKCDEVEAERKHIEERKALNDEKIERYKNKFMSDEEVNGLFELLNTEKGLTRKLEELKLFDC
ncbi:MAG: AAA family ATPase [Lachnospiraceae bacterium]|nr:AAA family ATPase [Lachnospiraceae bacterium]